MKIITMEEAVNLIQDGQCLMVGGFGLAGEPRPLLHALAESDVKDLDIISNSSGGENKGVGRLVYAHKVKRLQCSHIGGCKETQRQAMAVLQQAGGSGRELRLVCVDQGGETAALQWAAGEED